MARQKSVVGKEPEGGLEVWLELAEALCDLTLRQKMAVQSADWHGLREVLQEKDERIQGFEKAGVSLQELPKTVLPRIKRKLLAIQRIEEECRETLIEERQRAAGDLQAIKKAYQGIKRSKLHRSSIPRFVDLRR